MIGIVDYGVGNLGSIRNMFRYLGVDCTITSDPVELNSAHGLILPGVGAFDRAMARLNDSGLVSLLNRRVLEERSPVLGICLGMQMMTQRSEEGQLPGLGWLPARTVSFEGKLEGRDLPIPNMGWREVEWNSDHPMTSDGLPGSRYYFAHSYHVVSTEPASVLGKSWYGRWFHAAVWQDNIIGMQFHPEKSHRHGMLLLSRFAELAS